MRNAPYRLQYLNTFFSVGVTVWEGLGGWLAGGRVLLGAGV